MGQPRKGLFLFGNIKELNYICPMQPKAKFWVDFFNYLFRVVTFKKIIPQPRKIKRLNKIMSFESRMRITSIMSNVWRGRAWGIARSFCVNFINDKQKASY